MALIAEQRARGVAKGKLRGSYNKGRIIETEEAGRFWKFMMEHGEDVNKCVRALVYTNPGFAVMKKDLDDNDTWEDFHLNVTAKVLHRGYYDKYDAERAGPGGIKSYMIKMFLFTARHINQDFTKAWAKQNCGDAYDYKEYKARQEEGREVNVQAGSRSANVFLDDSADSCRVSAVTVTPETLYIYRDDDMHGIEDEPCPYGNMWEACFG